MSLRNFILKQRKLPRQHPLLKKVLLLLVSVILSLNLYVQKYRPEYGDETPTPWWLSSLILIAILVYLWVKTKVKTKGYLYLLLSVVIVGEYTLILLSKDSSMLCWLWLY